MQTDRMLYLALRGLLDVIVNQEVISHLPGSTARLMYPLRDASLEALQQYELEMGPLPEWASAHNISGEPVLYAQLYTKNGRQRGNGMIYDIGTQGVNFGIITDMGNTSVLTREELLSIYEIGDFILNEEGYLKRKRQNPDNDWDLSVEPSPE
jgi:hypothetical protein